MYEKSTFVSGKRKTAVAKVRLSSGNGEVLFNGVPYQNLGLFHRLAISEPLLIAKNVIGNLNLDIRVKVVGGGKEGQIQAARLGIAKAILKFSKSKELREAYMKYDRNILVADIRRKEAYKPDDSKARAKRQSSKR